MIREDFRAATVRMVKLGHWEVRESMRLAWINPKRFKALYQAAIRTQQPDERHHAPCCPANHYHNCRLVFHRCTCGARSPK